MPLRLGWIEIVLILLIIFIIFGAGKLPQLFESIGRGIRAFRTGKKAEEEGEAAGKKRKAA